MSESANRSSSKLCSICIEYGSSIAVLASRWLADTAKLWISSTSRRCSEMTHSFATRNDWMMKWWKFSNNGTHGAQQPSRLAVVVPFYLHRHQQPPAAAAVSVLAAPIITTIISSIPASALTMLPSTTATVKVQNISTREHLRDRRKDWTRHSMPPMYPQKSRPPCKKPP